MSVLVKGMEMPKSCVDCPMFEWDLEYLKCKANDKFFLSKGEWRTKRESTCPLIDAPPHGRLIDADAVISRLEHCEEIVSMLRVSIEIKEIYFSLIGEMKEEIENVPTVIPADKDGET